MTSPDENLPEVYAITLAGNRTKESPPGSEAAIQGGPRRGFGNDIPEPPQSFRHVNCSCCLCELIHRNEQPDKGAYAAFPEPATGVPTGTRWNAQEGTSMKAAGIATKVLNILVSSTAWGIAAVLPLLVHATESASPAPNQACPAPR